jgi:hypothetical protein
MMSMRCILIMVFCAFHCSLLFSETRISGDISKITFNNSGNPFIVENDIEVPAGKKVVMDEGCVLLFKEFTKLSILGSIIVNGTVEKPVVFSSLHDTAYNPKSQQLANPFDWNGLLIDKNADSVYLGNFKLMYSVFGIKSQKENIIIKNGYFLANGQFHVTINDKIQYVQDNIAFSYHVQQTKQNTATANIIVKSEPQGASLEVNGNPIDNVTPLTLKDLKPGVYKLYARKENVEGCEEVSLSSGDIKEIVIVLNKSKSLLSISSTPKNAEVYINKKPGSRIEPDAHTPASLKSGTNAQINLTLFKKGYADTTFVIDIVPCQTTMASVTLRGLDQKALAEQNDMLWKRCKVRIGRFSLISSPVFLIGAVGLFYLAQHDYKDAKDAKDFLDNAITRTDQYTAMEKKYSDSNRRGNTKTSFGFVLLGIGCIAAGTGLVLYF